MRNRCLFSTHNIERKRRLHQWRVVAETKAWGRYNALPMGSCRRSTPTLMIAESNLQSRIRIMTTSARFGESASLELRNDCDRWVHLERCRPEYDHSYIPRNISSHLERYSAEPNSLLRREYYRQRSFLETA